MQTTTATTRYAIINGTRTPAPDGAIAWKYADPFDAARWIHEGDETLSDIQAADPDLLARVYDDVPIRTLEQLRDAMIDDDPRLLDRHGNWDADLPTFGGAEPDDTVDIWSWDETRLLVGKSNDDLEIMLRADDGEGE